MRLRSDTRAHDDARADAPVDAHADTRADAHACALADARTHDRHAGRCAVGCVLVWVPSSALSTMGCPVYYLKYCLNTLLGSPRLRTRRAGRCAVGSVLAECLRRRLMRSTSAR